MFTAPAAGLPALTRRTRINYPTLTRKDTPNVLTLIDSDLAHTETATNSAPAADVAQRPEFHITDEAGANWYAKKLANLEAERARVRAQAAAIVAQLDADEKHLRRLYEDEAREWARGELAKRGNRRRSLTLLQGTFAFRTVPATLRVDDLAAALNTAVEVGAVKVDADAYRRYALDTLKATGEILPGCVPVGEREHFSVRFGKDSSADTSANGKESEASD